MCAFCTAVSRLLARKEIIINVTANNTTRKIARVVIIIVKLLLISVCVTSVDIIEINIKFKWSKGAAMKYDRPSAASSICE
jgi:hypothetical protein